MLLATYCGGDGGSDFRYVVQGPQLTEECGAQERRLGRRQVLEAQESANPPKLQGTPTFKGRRKGTREGSSEATATEKRRKAGHCVETAAKRHGGVGAAVSGRGGAPAVEGAGSL